MLVDNPFLPLSRTKSCMHVGFRVNWYCGHSTTSTLGSIRLSSELAFVVTVDGSVEIFVTLSHEILLSFYFSGIMIICYIFLLL